MRCNQDGSALCDCGGWCAIPPAEALGWPQNIAHATSPHQAQLARFAQSAAEVVAVSATGDELTSDLVVTEGHRHEAIETVILWRQLGSWVLTTQSIAGVQSVGLPVTSTIFRQSATFFFRVPLSDTGTKAPYQVLYPRARVSVPTPGGPETTLELRGDICRIGAGGVIVVIAVLPPMRISSQVGPPAISYVNRWFGWSAIEVSEADLVLASGRLCLLLRVAIDVAAQTGTLFEVGVSLLDCP